MNLSQIVYAATAAQIVAGRREPGYAALHLSIDDQGVLVTMTDTREDRPMARFRMSAEAWAAEIQKALAGDAG